MGLFRRCKEQWALVKEMRTMFKAEWEHHPGGGGEPQR